MRRAERGEPARGRVSVLTRTLAPLRQFGFWPGLAYLVDRALSALPGRLRLRYYDFLAQPIGPEPLLPERFTRSIVVRAIAPGDPALAAMPVTPALNAQRFAEGASCLGAFRDDVLLAYLWFSDGAHREDEVRCDYVLEPAASSVFDFDVFVLPEHRVGFAFAALWEGARRHQLARGKQRSFSRVSRFNTDSIRAHRRLGARRIGSALVLQLAAVELLVGLRPRCLALTAAARSRPRLVLRDADAAPSAGGGAADSAR